MGEVERLDMKTVSIFGASGSIGKQALDVIRNSNGRYEVYALSVRQSIDTLIAQAREFRPKVVVVADEQAARIVKDDLPGIDVRFGDEGLSSTAAEADVALNSVVGFAGLQVTISALAAGKRLALANKESLVAAGPIVRSILKNSSGEIIPVDSEHAAIHQCLRGSNKNEVKSLILTSSGGPFRTSDAEELNFVTKDQALSHPIWSMGPKITIDSSTLMNKALEVIEAVELFDVRGDQVDVVIHPQSVVHSMVSFVDGSVIAQMSKPNMCLPIAYALGYPDRFEPEYGTLDFKNPIALSFEAPRMDVFRSLNYAYDAIRIGRGAPAWLSAVNEVVVDAFLRDEFRWIDIFALIESSMELFDPVDLEQPEDVVMLDKLARVRCQEVIDRWHNRGL